jgi:hypothetical protein
VIVGATVLLGGSATTPPTGSERVESAVVESKPFLTVTLRRNVCPASAD